MCGFSSQRIQHPSRRWLAKGARLISLSLALVFALPAAAKPAEPSQPIVGCATTLYLLREFGLRNPAGNLVLAPMAVDRVLRALYAVAKRETKIELDHATGNAPGREHAKRAYDRLARRPLGKQDGRLAQTMLLVWTDAADVRAEHGQAVDAENVLMLAVDFVYRERARRRINRLLAKHGVARGVAKGGVLGHHRGLAFVSSSLSARFGLRSVGRGSFRGHYKRIQTDFFAVSRPLWRLKTKELELVMLSSRSGRLRLTLLRPLGKPPSMRSLEGQLANRLRSWQKRARPLRNATLQLPRTRPKSRFIMQRFLVGVVPRIVSRGRAQLFRSPGQQELTHFIQLASLHLTPRATVSSTLAEGGDKPQTIRFDSPFLFFVEDIQSGAMLGFGRLFDPRF
jgi:hypothetical protein